MSQNLQWPYNDFVSGYNEHLKSFSKPTLRNVPPTGFTSNCFPKATLRSRYGEWDSGSNMSHFLSVASIFSAVEHKKPEVFRNQYWSDRNCLGNSPFPAEPSPECYFYKSLRYLLQNVCYACVLGTRILNDPNKCFASFWRGRGGASCCVYF